MNMLEVAEVIRTFFGWILKVLNALGITAFNEPLSNAMGKLQ